MKTQVDEINRNIYDIKNADNYEFKIKKGLTKEIIEEISKQKNDPDWMKQFRLKALEVYNSLELPTWGPNISELKMDEIATYVRPKTKLNTSWEDVPEDIKNTFDKLRNPRSRKKITIWSWSTIRFRSSIPQYKRRPHKTGCNIYRYGNSSTKISRNCKRTFYEMRTSK